MSATTYQRAKRRRMYLPNYRLVRYADDFVVMVHGSHANAQALKQDVAQVLAPMGLRLPEAGGSASPQNIHVCAAQRPVV